MTMKSTKGAHREKKPKTQEKTMDKYLRAILVTLLLFTITMIVVYVHTGGIPDTLVTCVFAAMTGECGFMAVIKSMKEKYKEKPEEPTDPEPVDAGEEDGTG